MASSIEWSSSIRISVPSTPGSIVIAYDASKNRNIQEFKDIIADVLVRGDMIQEADTITLLGVLDKVLHPSKLSLRILSFVPSFIV